MKRLDHISLMLLCLFITAVPSLAATPYDSGRITYQVKVDNSQNDYRLMSYFLLAQQSLTITVHDKKELLSFSVTDGKTVLASDVQAYQFVAPNQVGHYDRQIQIKQRDSSTLRFFVMRPATEIVKGYLNGYRIGEYPKERYKDLAIYDPPIGYVEVNAKNRDLHVSPHYKLGQFLSKQGGKFPNYLVMKTRLLRKLEYLTELVNKKGYRTDGFHIMSGYRTPYYNTLIKNKTYSRHQWGGAADIFLDENPKDNTMDDLNGDGKNTIDDARVLANMIEEKFAQEEYKPFIGGLGLYRKNAAHGPFMHVDVRGFKARW